MNRLIKDFDSRIEKIIEKKDEIISLEPHINGMWNTNLYIQYINLFNYIFDKNMQITGCGACRTKIKNIFGLLYAYMKQKNIIEKKDEIISLEPHINGMWNTNLYIQYIRTKIKNIFGLLYAYMKQKNIN